MNTERPVNYISQDRHDYITSNKYQVVIYRQDETITAEAVLEEFFDFVERESQYEMSTQELNRLQELINEFLFCDIAKVKAGEIEMLAKWNKSVNG